MKTAMTVSILLLVVWLIVGGSCATTRNAIPPADFFEVFSGTWINTEYSGTLYWRQKIVHHRDGRWENYYLIEDEHMYHHGTYSFDQMWLDPDGDTWFKCRRECLVCASVYLVLGKISESGGVLELLFQKSRYPTEMSPIEGLYLVYYRQ